MIKELTIWDLEVGEEGYGYARESSLNKVLLTPENITTVVRKLNEVIEELNRRNPTEENKEDGS